MSIVVPEGSTSLTEIRRGKIIAKVVAFFRDDKQLHVILYDERGKTEITIDIIDELVKHGVRMMFEEEKEEEKGALYLKMVEDMLKEVT